MKTITTFAQLVQMIEALESQGKQVFVRYCRGPQADASGRSTNHQTGEVLAGLSCNSLHAPDWWCCNGRKADGYIAMQVRDYSYLRYQGGRGTAAYILTGDIVGTGSDNETLISNVAFVAKIANTVVEECNQR